MKGALNEQKSEHLREEEGTPGKSVVKPGSGYTVDQSSPGGQTRNGVGKESRVRP